MAWFGVRVLMFCMVLVRPSESFFGLGQENQRCGRNQARSDKVERICRKIAVVPLVCAFLSILDTRLLPFQHSQLSLLWEVVQEELAAAAAEMDEMVPA